LLARCAWIAALVGVALIAGAIFMSPYKNAAAFENAVALNNPTDEHESAAATAAFHAARKEQLTPKFALEDYGFVFLEISALLLFASRKWRVKDIQDVAELLTPTKSSLIFILGLLGAVTTVAAYVSSIFLDFSRGAFPPWADSIVIPLISTPFLLLILLAVAAIFSAAASPRYKGGLRLGNVIRGNARPHFGWLILLGVPAIASGSLVVLNVATGDPLFLLPSILWFSFFALFLGGHHSSTSTGENEPSTTPVVIASES
jgi:hypothetical protein